MWTARMKWNKDSYSLTSRGWDHSDRKQRDIRGGNAVSLTEGSDLPPLGGKTHSLPGSVTLRVREQRLWPAGAQWSLLRVPRAS